MSYAFDSRLGEQLYQLLPEVYRTRDKMAGQVGGGTGTEDLAKYMDVHGHLLDLIHATLEQQLKDALPKSSQDWLLPYFAQLLAANIVSPDSEGKHAEIDNAVSWRQRKGTLKCAEEIAEAVGQMEVEIQEGWKRVAMTPRIGMPLMPAKVWDDTLDIDMKVPSEAIRHPTLPAAMVDLRRSSRAVEAKATNPAAKVSSFGGIKQSWRQANHHGVPCFPDSFDDVSRRTVDIRTPDLTNGHYHHKRLLAYTPPPAGFFPFPPIQLTWGERHHSLYEHLIEEKQEDGVWLILNRTKRIIEITDDVPLVAGVYRIEGISFLGELKVPNGGRLELNGVEAKKVSVPTSSTEEPVLIACDCLFKVLSSAGLVKLDSCTVLGTSYLTSIEALDSIFMDIQGTEITGVIEYSRIPENAPLNADKNKMTIKSHNPDLASKYGYVPVTDDPSFISGQNSIAARAVLSANAPRSIYEGASDQGEMGYFHNGRKGRPVLINGILSFDLPDDGGYQLEDLIFGDAVRVTNGKLKLTRAAVREITVETTDDNLLPVLDAKDCLFDKLTVDIGLARLEYCTIMKDADCEYLQASDCIFIGNITVGTGNEPESGCLRYSRIPEGFDGKELNVITGRTDTNTRAIPIFNEFIFCESAIGNLVIDPNNSAIIYAGSNGSGVFKSNDGGDNWAAMNTGLTDLDVQALAVDPAGKLYGGTNGGGVFKSEDGGLSWIDINTGLNDLNVQTLVIDPNDSAIIYAGSNGSGVFKIGVGDDSWATMNKDLTNLDVQTLVIAPAGTLYVGTNGGGVFKWDDSGLNWDDMNTGLTDLDVKTLAVDSTGTLYVGTNGGGVFKWDDSGLNWVDMNTGLINLDVQALIVDSAGTLYVGTNGGGVFKSEDGGLNWADMNTGLTNLVVQALIVDPVDTLYVGTNGGGVFSSYDGGLNWAQKKTTISREESVRRNAVFGEAGYGVLNPVTHDAIRFGAEDGGEMGAYHHKYYSLKAEAVLDKMREFLPVGIEPVLIQDTRLLHVPPERQITEESKDNGDGS